MLVFWFLVLIFFFFNMEKGNVNQLPEIMAKYKQGSSNSISKLIFWEPLSNSKMLERYKNSKTYTKHDQHLFKT